MSEGPIDVTHEILVRIQQGITDARREMLEFRHEMVEFKQASERRLGHIETVLRKQRRESAGMLVLMQAAAGDFDARVSLIEERLAALEPERG